MVIKKQSKLTHDELINVTKIPRTKRCDWGCSHVRLSAPPHRPSPTDQGWRKVNRIVFHASPSSAFHTKFTKSDLKSLCWSPQPGPQNLMTPLLLNTIFVKTGIEKLAVNGN